MFSRDALHPDATAFHAAPFLLLVVSAAQSAHLDFTATTIHKKLPRIIYNMNVNSQRTRGSFYSNLNTHRSSNLFIPSSEAIFIAS